MLVSEMIDDVLLLTTLPDTDIMGDKRKVMLRYISSVQRDWAVRTQRFTKIARCYTRATGGEDAQSKYSLIARPGSTTGGLPYSLVSVLGVLFDQDTPLEPVGYKRYMAEKHRHGGTAYYNDPRMFWVHNGVLHLIPIPSTVALLRVLYAARPNVITAETENIVITDTDALLHGVSALMFSHIRDFERAAIHDHRYSALARERAARGPIESGSWSPYQNVDQPQGYVGTATGDLFL